MKRNLFVSILFFLSSSFSMESRSATIDKDMSDMMFACAYLYGNRSVLMDGIPEPCKPILSFSATIEDFPVVRAIQLYVESKSDPGTDTVFLREFASLSKERWIEMASDPFFMTGFSASLFSVVQGAGRGKPRHHDLNDFVVEFYRNGLKKADFDELYNGVTVLSCFVQWFFIQGETGLFIDALEEIRKRSEGDAAEGNAYYAIFTAGQTLNGEDKRSALLAMQEHFGKSDWRSVYALDAMVLQSQINSNYFRPWQKKGEEQAPDVLDNVDLWPTMSTWLESDILASAPNTAATVLMNQARRSFNKRRYEQAEKIARYILDSALNDSSAFPSSYLYTSNAYAMGIDVIVAMERYSELKPYLDRYGQFGSLSGPGR